MSDSAPVPAADPAEATPPDSVILRQEGDTIREETPFAGGVIDGHAKIYAPEGWLQRVAQFKAGQLDGETVQYESNGDVAARFTFAEGQLNGPAVVYANGRPSQAMNFADGVMDGEMQSYDAAGALVGIAHYAGGRLEGEARTLRPDDGSPVRLAHYHDGKLEGEVVDYWENGNVRQRSLYKNNVPDGLTTTYLMTGEPDQEIVFAEGKPVEVRRPVAAAPVEGAAPARPPTWIDRLIAGA